MERILLEVPTFFETERLTIRSPQPGDGKAVNEAIAETFEALHLWMPWAATLPTIEESEIILRNAWIKYLSREDFMLLLFLKGTNTVVGSSGLHPRDWKVPSFEIGYWCRKSFEGQGYIAEAVEGITRFGFEVMKARRIIIRCDEQNVRSKSVAERAGYNLEGRFVNDALNTSGELRTTLTFAKTR